MLQQGPGMMQQGPGMMQQGPGMMQQGPGMMQQGPGLMQQGPGMMQQGQGMMSPGAGSEIPGSSIPERPPPPTFNSTPAPTCPTNPQTDEEKRQVILYHSIFYFFNDLKTL